jgi:NADPH:quinone reductase-like Zn-dependent oxidoreductase
MKAVWHAVHGGPEVLEVVELPDPKPGPNEVVVEVRAAGLNRLDILQRTGPPLLPGFRLPHIPGMDIAGVVAATGSSVEALETGTRVVVKPGVHCGRCEWCTRVDDRLCTSVQVTGGTRPGGYAEYCAVPSTHVFAIPEGASFEEAATIPTAVSTAWRAIVQTAQVQAGEFVVIHGPGSGVSIAAVQIAKHAGATVIVTGRSEQKLRRALQVGADHVVDEAAPDVVDQVRRVSEGRGANVVLNHVGPALFELSVHLLRPDGRLVHCGTTTGTSVTLQLPYLYHAGIQILGVGPQGYADFAGMLDRYWEEQYQAVIDSCFPLQHAADAQVRLDSGEVFGKVLLCP